MRPYEIRVAWLQERQGHRVLEDLPDAGRRALEHRVVGVGNDHALGLEQQFRLDGGIGWLEQRSHDHVHFALQQPAALGFVARSNKLMWGLFNQNLFSFAGDGDRADLNVSILQPIVNYSLPDKWSIGTSEMNIAYDWERDAWTALPLGVKVARLVKLGKLPVQFAGAYEYNFANDYVAPEWTVNFTVKFVFPTGRP